METFDLNLWKGFQAAGGDPSLPAFIDQIVIDSRRIDSPHSLFIALKGASHDGHQFLSHAVKAGARYALVEHHYKAAQEFPKVTFLRVQDPLQAFHEIAATYRKAQSAQVIAITGSFGKTMLKDLLQVILSTTKQTISSPESFNSRIGVPLSLMTIRKSDHFAIIEAGISQKGEMASLASMIQPDCAILTNIGNAHSATLKDLTDVAQEKIKLFQLSGKGSWNLIPNDPYLHPHLENLHHPVHYWNKVDPHLPSASYLRQEFTSKMPYQVTFPDGFQFSGTITSGFSFFLDLINMAVKAAWLLEIPSEAISQALKNYTPGHMRTEIWKSPVGATFINNTYSSDPQSIELALRHLHAASPEGRKFFLFGGLRETQPHTSSDYKNIGQSIAKAGIHQLILYHQQEIPSLIEEVNRHSPQTKIYSCNHYLEALQTLRSQVKHQDTVLIKGAYKESLNTLIEVFNDSIANNQCLVNLSAIQSNIEVIRSHLEPGTRVMAIVKALAYGTDDVRISQFLSACHVNILGVSYVEEAVSLRRAGVALPIFVINAALYEAAKAVKWDLEVGVSDSQLIEALAKEAEQFNKKVKVHLHIDTGMNRFGCRPEDALSLAQQIHRSPFLIFEAVMTHFTSADMPEEDPFTLHQVAVFEKNIKELKDHGLCPPWQHASNSSAALRFRFPQFNMVRLGLAIYGLYPSEAVKQALELRLALSLTSRIVGINHCRKGETISYGRSYTVRKNHQKIAVLPIGYFDGLHRNYSGKGHVIIRGQKAPMVGRICMDYMMVDVTNIPNVSVGDSVLIFGVDEHGQYLSPEELANRGNSIAHELVTCLGPRIQRIFLHE